VSDKENSAAIPPSEKSNADIVRLSPKQAAAFLIVGIGASAGGIRPLRDFFENIPVDSGCAYVVILHLSPEFESRLAEILQGKTSIPVQQVRDTVKVQANHAYVIPPNKSLQMYDGMLTLKPVTSFEERRAPIDIFFRTLADNHDARSVAVILSGTGADGSMGVKRVKERGGIIIVQHPEEAEYKDMPTASLDTNLVDFVLPVTHMPGQILQYRDHLKSLQLPEDDSDDRSNREEREEELMHQIFVQLRVKTGHDFTAYKRATTLRRIARRMGVRSLDTLHDYVTYLKNHPEEADALLKDLLISVTNFFRDRPAFDWIEKEVVPAILKEKKGSDEIRIWIAGCATGEEAYSLAMLFSEQIEDMPDPPQLQLFATDIDDDAIAVAREGLYSNADVADVSPERLQRFFIQEGDMYRVRRNLRECILFAHHNVLRDPPFSRLNLATCRNLLIYLMRSAQNRVLQTIHFALEPGGYLFLGSSESVDGTGDLFITLEREQSIYQSRAVQSRPVPPVPEVPAAYRTTALLSAVPSVGPIAKRLEKLSLTTLHYKVLEHYAPPSVLVNAEYDIVHLSERAGEFLQIAGGEPSYNLLKAIREELRMELRTALYSAVQDSSVFRTSPIPVKLENGIVMVTLVVRPVLDPTDTAKGFLLVLFEKGDWLPPEEIIRTAGGPEGIAKHLEQELAGTRLQLRSAVEQYEIQTEELRASNEELQAINEELRSAAEELETGKEEVQSINEELTTVNQELKVKIDELSHAHNDFQNLMAATDIGTVFLDRNFNVKMFTPAAQDIFKLLPTDQGRPLSDITHTLRDIDIMTDAMSVMQRLIPVEREVHAGDGRAYLMRISPYRTTEDRISGVVATFIDVSQRVQAIEEQRISELRFRTMTNAIPQLVWTNEAGGVANYFNQRWYEYSGLTFEESFGPGWQVMVHPDDAATSIARWQEALRTGDIFDTEYRLRRHDGVYRWHIGRNVPLRDDNGTIIAWFGSATDIEDLKQAEADLRESEERLRLIVESTTDYAIFTMDLNRMVNSWNTGAEAVFGYTEREIIGQAGDILFVEEDILNGAPEQESSTALAEGRAADERWHRRKDGSRFYASGVMTLLQDGDLHGFVKIARDLTEKMIAEQRLRASEERYQSFISQSSEGIWRFEMDEGVDTTLPAAEQVELIYKHSYLAECNDAIARMYGYSNASEMQSARLSDLLPQDERTQAYLRQFIHSGYRISDAETLVPDKDGTERHFINNLVGIVEAGKLKRAWGMQRDITERKALEKVKEDFIGIASHELRTPVTSIKAYVELLNDTLLESADKDSVGLVQKLDGQVDRLTALIKDLLDVTKISEGKLPLLIGSFSVNQLVEEVVEELQRTTKHRLELDLQPAPEVPADRDRIRQVLFNLIINAIKYSPGKDRVVISSAVDAQTVTIRVQDFGIGLSEEAKKMAFERFFRARDEGINTYPGLGLGLYIAAEIVQRHKGSIWVESAPGEGATFCFSLPLTEEAQSGS
jgi:two-component system CheB/CheR fusion protein